MHLQCEVCGVWLHEVFLSFSRSSSEKSIHMSSLTYSVRACVCVFRFLGALTSELYLKRIYGLVSVSCRVASVLHYIIIHNPAFVRHERLQNKNELKYTILAWIYINEQSDKQQSAYKIYWSLRTAWFLLRWQPRKTHSTRSFHLQYMCPGALTWLHFIQYNY